MFQDNDVWKLTLEFRESTTFPLHVGSRFVCMIGVTGRDDVLFILGVNIFVSDNDLEMEGFSRGAVFEVSGARLAAFSISELELRYLKLSFGKRPFKEDLALDKEGPGEPLVLASAGFKLKFTLLGVGVGLGVGGILIMTDSCEESSSVLEGISKKRFLRFQF